MSLLEYHVSVNRDFLLLIVNFMDARSFKYLLLSSPSVYSCSISMKEHLNGVLLKNMGIKSPGFFKNSILLKQIYNIGYEYELYENALLIATFKNYIELVQVLVHHERYIYDISSAATIAAQHGNMDILKIFVSMHNGPKSSFFHGCCDIDELLINASDMLQIEVVQYLLGSFLFAEEAIQESIEAVGYPGNQVNFQRHEYLIGILSRSFYV